MTIDVNPLVAKTVVDIVLTLKALQHSRVTIAKVSILTGKGDLPLGLKDFEDALKQELRDYPIAQDVIVRASSHRSPGHAAVVWIILEPELDSDIPPSSAVDKASAQLGSTPPHTW